MSFIDLSHTIHDGLETYLGLPAPSICDYWRREESAAHYDEGTSFQIGRIDMVANTGTYIDAPFHRYSDGRDVAALQLTNIASVPGRLFRHTGDARAIDASLFGDAELEGCAVLVCTGWSRHWNTPAYFHGHPFLTEDAAARLRDAGAALVGIDSLNIDYTGGGARPVHSLLLGAGIPIVEHLCNLGTLADSARPKDAGDTHDKAVVGGFTFTAVPAPVRGMGSFPVRAYAEFAS